MQWTPTTQGHFRTVYELTGAHRDASGRTPEIRTFVSPKLRAGVSGRVSRCVGRVLVCRQSK